MTKLGAWRKWLELTGSGNGADEHTLLMSSHGKTFSFAWDMAVEAVSNKLQEMHLELINRNPTNIQDLLNTKVLTVPFDVRAQNVFRAEGIETVRDLLVHTEATLNRMPNLGKKSIERIKAELYTVGLKLGEIPISLESNTKRPNRIEGNLTPRPRKKKENKMTAIMAKARKRRDAIYRRWNNGELSYGDLAIEFGVTPGRIHQIIKRAGRERNALNDDLPSIEYASKVAKSLPIPPWLLEETKNEPSHDQRS